MDQDKIQNCEGVVESAVAFMGGCRYLVESRYAEPNPNSNATNPSFLNETKERKMAAGQLFGILVLEDPG